MDIMDTNFSSNSDLFPVFPKEQYSVGSLDILPMNKPSEQIFQQAEHALIGVSPLNGYYTEKTIETTLRWALTHFKWFDVCLPDQISAYTLQAVGYPELIAKKKTKRQDAHLLNKVMRVFNNIGFSETEARQHIVKLSDVKDLESFKEIKDRCLAEMEKNPLLKKSSLETTAAVLRSIKGGTFHPEQINCAAKYYYSELPFYVDTPRLLNRPSSVFIYHKVMPSVEELFETTDLMAANQGHLTVSVRDPSAALLAEENQMDAPHNTYSVH